MISKKSIFSKSIFKRDFLYSLVFMAMNFLGFYFFLSNRILEILNTRNFEKVSILNELKNTLVIDGTVDIFILFSIPIIISVVLFNYIYSQEKIDFYHSMPINRKSLFFTKSLVAFLAMCIPLLLIAIINFLIMKNNNYFTNNSQNGLLLQINAMWFLKTFVLEMFIFSISSFIGMFSGMKISHAIFSLISFFLPIMIPLIIFQNLEYWVIGFSAQNARTILDPMGKHIDVMFNNSTKIEDLVLFFLTSIVILFLSYLVYKNRKSEYVQEAVVFSFFKELFRYGFVFCFALASFLTFRSMSYNPYFTYYIYILIAAYIADAILKQSFNVFEKEFFRKIIIMFACFVILSLSLKIDILGFKKIPDIADVEKVYFGHSYEFERFQAGDYKNKLLYKDRDIFLKDKKNIKRVIDLNQKLIQKQKVNFNKGERRYIVYKMKNGKLKVRQYFCSYGEFKPEISKILNTIEYKKSNYAIFSIKPENIKRIEIQKIEKNNIQKNVQIVDKNEIQKLLISLKNDILNKDEDKTEKTSIVIEFILNQKNDFGDKEYYDLNISDSYKTYYDVLKYF